MMRLGRRIARLMFCLLPALMLCAVSAAQVEQSKMEIPVAPEVLAQYVGVYELAPTFKLMITVEGNQLMAQASGQSKMPVFASSPTKFFYKVVDAQIEFLKDATGVVSSLVLYQNNREMPAPRISDKVEEKKAIEVSRAILSQYVGTYELKPGFDMVITLENGQLITQATGQPKIPIFAESETKFFPKVMDAQIEFLKDDKGAVTHLMLHQGPAEIKAPRK
jgi:hypothetical protein